MKGTKRLPVFPDMSAADGSEGEEWHCLLDEEMDETSDTESR